MTIAWITGGGTGIGRALAEKLLAEGARVVISGRRADVLDQTVRDLATRRPGSEVIGIPGDASEPDAIQSLVNTVKARWGDIDLLINNAGSNANRSFRTAPPEEYAQAFVNNCLSAIRATVAVLPAMIAARRGAIVNISSIYGQWAASTSASYSVSKYALAGYTDVLRQGLVGSGVHVLGVYPGYIVTPMTEPFVKRGSLRSFLGKTPEALAGAIWRALRRKRAVLSYPWYVSPVVALHRWWPGLLDRAAGKVKR